MPRSYHHGDLREALLEATLHIVRTAGPDAVTLRDVAKRAGVSEAAPYHHFESKSHLLLDAAARGYRTLGERLAMPFETARSAPTEARAGATDSPKSSRAEAVRTARARLIAVGAAYVRFALDEPGYFRLLFGAHVVELVAHPASAGTKAAGQAAAAHLRRAVTELHAAIRAPLSVQELERIVWAQVHGLAWLVLEQELRPAPSAAEAVSLAETALGAIVDGVQLSGAPHRSRGASRRPRAPSDRGGIRGA